ncbi:hypothetical protein LLG95_04550 [bacterium]|nr:hypothetical protein [bacterium]
MAEQYFHAQITHRLRPLVQEFKTGVIYDTNEWAGGSLYTAKYRKWRDSFIPHLSKLSSLPMEEIFFQLLNQYIESPTDFLVVGKLAEIENVGNQLVQAIANSSDEIYKGKMLERRSALTEMIFEIIRIHVAPKKPSRFRCIFLMRNEFFRKYIHRLLSPQMLGIVFYKIEPINAEISEHDATWLDRHLADRFDVHEIAETARHYWAQDQTDDPLMEVLCVGSFKSIASSLKMDQIPEPH